MFTGSTAQFWVTVWFFGLARFICAVHTYFSICPRKASWLQTRSAREGASPGCACRWAEMTDLQWRTCKTKTCEALGNLHAATPTMSWRHSDHAALALKDLIKDWCLCTSCCCLLVDLWHAFRYGCQAQGMISWWSAAGLHLAMKALDLDTISVCAAD